MLCQLQWDYVEYIKWTCLWLLYVYIFIPGVIAMSWCPNDSSYLLTCAKDNRTICWDTVTAEVWLYFSLSTRPLDLIFWFLRVPQFMFDLTFFSSVGPDCMWITCRHQLEFWCALVSESTWSDISIFIRWKNWDLQYWGMPFFLLLVWSFST